MSSVLRQITRSCVSISYILQTLHFELSSKSGLTLAVHCIVPVQGCPACQKKATAATATGATSLHTTFKTNHLHKEANFNVRSLSLHLGIRQFLGALYEVTKERITLPSVAEYQIKVCQNVIECCRGVPTEFRQASVNCVQVSSVTATLRLARST
jgi:hypothetical protein